MDRLVREHMNGDGIVGHESAEPHVGAIAETKGFLKAGTLSVPFFTRTLCESLLAVGVVVIVLSEFILWLFAYSKPHIAKRELVHTGTDEDVHESPSAAARK